MNISRYEDEVKGGLKGIAIKDVIFIRLIIYNS